MRLNRQNPIIKFLNNLINQLVKFGRYNSPPLRIFSSSKIQSTQPLSTPILDIPNTQRIINQQLLHSGTQRRLFVLTILHGQLSDHIDTKTYTTNHNDIPDISSSTPSTPS